MICSNPFPPCWAKTKGNSRSSHISKYLKINMIKSLSINFKDVQNNTSHSLTFTSIPAEQLGRTIPSVASLGFLECQPEHGKMERAALSSWLPAYGLSLFSAHPSSESLCEWVEVRTAYFQAPCRSSFTSSTLGAQGRIPWWYASVV